MKMTVSSSWLPAALIALVISQSAIAQEPTWFGQSADGRWLIGIKGGTVDKTTTGFSDSSGYGINLGYEFARPIGFNGSASLEFEYMSADDGDFNADSDFGVDGLYDAETYALFFAYRTPGTVFFKGKVGLVNANVDINSTAGNEKQTDTSVGFGLGFGVRAGENVYLELEYTDSTGDDDLNYITLGASFLF